MGSTGNGKIESTWGISGQKNPMLNNSISRVIRWYKGRCTHEIRKLIPELYFQWQPRFYDHIIRNENEYYQISNWTEDKYYNI